MNNEDIKVLEEFINETDSLLQIIDEDTIHEIDFPNFEYEQVEALRNLIKGYKELEIINKMQEYRISVIDERELIPKSKVREFFEKSKVVKNESKDKTYLLIDVSDLDEELLQEGDDK